MIEELSMAEVKERAHRRMLLEELEQFIADWRENADADGWVEVRLVRVTSQIRWELYEAGMIELAGRKARPAPDGEAIAA